MKAIKVNAAISTAMGMQVPAGAIVVLNEGYANVGARQENKIPAQVSNSTFASLADYEKKTVPVPNITDYPGTMDGYLTVEDYTTMPTESLLIGMLYNVLESVYPGKVEIIDLP